MKFELLCVRDRAADVYGQPFCSTSVGAAIRGFGDEVNRADEKNPIYNHPEDFDLYYLGYFDDSDGRFVTDTPRQVAIGKDLKRS